MSWNFGLWLHQHEVELEARWLAAVQGLPAYDVPAEERLSYWHLLVEALTEDQAEALSTKVHEWADREARERGATPSELLSVADGLSQAIRDLLSPGEDMVEANRRLNDLMAAVAFYFAGQVERLDVKKSQLESLYEITRELASGLDLSRLLQRTLAEVTEAIAAERGAIFLVDGATGQVKPEAKIAWDGEEIPLDALPSAWQLGQPEPLLILDDLQIEQTEAWARTLVGSSAGSLIVAPLVATGEFQGLLTVASSRVGAFDADCARLFRAVLGQIATAIGNAQVYRLLSQQAQELGQTLRHQQEEATKSHAILASIADGVVVNDTEGQIILINPAAKHILGLPDGDLSGQGFRDLFSSFDAKGREEAVAAMEMFLGTPDPGLPQAFRVTLGVGDRVINSHLAPVLTRSGDPLGVVTVLRDITKEVEADRAKSEFVSTVSHELRTPMTAIKGYTDLLHAGAVGPINDEQRHFLNIIRDNADRLTALISDLLDISRVETGRIRFEPRSMQIGEAIANVVNALAGQSEAKRQTLIYEVAGGMPDIMADRDRIIQVLTNLIGNAIHYTPDGGEVHVRAYPVEGAVRVDVRDTGIGIAPEDLGHVFERFYRADHPLVRESRGTGLGLSIVKVFVEMHNGRVWVESEPGEGSTFTFILPVSAETEEEGRQPPLRLVTRVRTVLIVDDDHNVTDLVETQLEGGGYKVLSLAKGRPVVAWAEEKRPDLIILDLILPDVEGLEVLRNLKESPITADIPVVVMTVVPDDGTARDLGAVDYLTKPVDAKSLLRSVEEALTWQGHVLIVDDEPDAIELLSATMRRIGFTPLVAADGYEALAMARRHRPELILLDLRLPGMDGFEALTHLKRDAITQAIPIIAISAHVTDVEQGRKRLVALGVASFLPKPFSVAELLSEVEAAVQPVSGPDAL